MFKNPLIRYLLKFVCCFCILYYGTKAMAGITAPGGGFYWEFADKYLNYVAWLRTFLMSASTFVLELAGYDIYMKDIYTIRMQGGMGVHIVYSCLGYGVMSFWIAFVFANSGTFRQKLFWILLGLLVIFTVNVSRVCLMLVAVNKKWKTPLGFDNHTWFNIAAYTAIFIMMWLFDKSSKRRNRGITAS